MSQMIGRNRRNYCIAERDMFHHKLVKSAPVFGSVLCLVARDLSVVFEYVPFRVSVTIFEGGCQV